MLGSQMLYFFFVTTLFFTSKVFNLLKLRKLTSQVFLVCFIYQVHFFSESLNFLPSFIKLFFPRLLSFFFLFHLATCSLYLYNSLEPLWVTFIFEYLHWALSKISYLGF